ncbi:putative phytochelatin synthase [Crocosphaera subtropica ATCC 51142]|uniref:glutathione gamma-glutamylcysteinyltransferase n=1 Tax=Crocosphaera subtropica (strain ATCC 51142 / BH68) TaxID=43989 RepID=B1X0F7_CROS5|nr:phytochelatin synthase family protein [Crocosphaera subtropica]ACB51246.1 putative phytochelatin synthase [Crocosphaera subtropica ATCC 51142]
MKLKKLIAKLLLLGVGFVPSQLLAQTSLPLAENLINFNSSQGETLLVESKARQDYIPLSLQFETQENLAFCGVASIVMVLNALSIPAPKATEWVMYHRFTQDNVFDNPKTESIITKETVSRQGMTLQELAGLLKSYPVEVEVYHGNEVSLPEFRQRIINNLKQENNFVLVNYLRSTIGQERGGHISPIAAYNEQSDRFLILDVSRYKYPPVWVKAEDLWKATNTIDSVSKKTRGFVLINTELD